MPTLCTQAYNAFIRGKLATHGPMLGGRVSASGQGAEKVVQDTSVFDIRATAGRSTTCKLWKDLRIGRDPAKKAKYISSNQNLGKENQENSNYKYNNKRLSDQLTDWRDCLTFNMAMEEMSSQKRGKQFTMATLFSGGLLDTFAAVRCGFTPIWGAEIDTNQQRMWEKFTNSPNVGDVFGPKVLKAKRPHYIKSGAPCPDYCKSGSKLGAHGKTGWMFKEQANVINCIQPWAFCLEISEHALFVNDADEDKYVKTLLSRNYVIKSKVIRVWQHGDVSNR